MSTVSFKRSADVNNIPIIDGQLIFDETYNKIYMDNGNQRLQYGGDVSLISNTDYATSNNAFSASASLNIFTRQDSVVDNKSDALIATEPHLPVGCLAFQSTIGIDDYSGVGNTVSSALITLNNHYNGINNQLTANSHKMYMDYHDGKYGVNTSSSRGADTFIPFKKSYWKVPYLYGIACGDNRNLQGEYQFDVSENDIFRIGSYSFNYGGGMTIYADSTNIGGAELVGTTINVSNVNIIRIVYSVNVGVSFSQSHFYNIEADWD